MILILPLRLVGTSFQDVLSGRLAGTSCQDVLSGRLIRTSCQEVLPGRFGTSCQDVLSGGLVRTSCQDVLSVRFVRTFCQEVLFYCYFFLLFVCSNVSLPFNWQIMKRCMRSCDTRSLNDKNKKSEPSRDEHSVFKIYPDTGVLQPASSFDFKIESSPIKVGNTVVVIITITIIVVIVIIDITVS